VIIFFLELYTVNYGVEKEIDMEKQKIGNIKLWKKFQEEKIKSKKDIYRQKLVEAYYPLVQKISYRVAQNLQWNLQPEELASFGVDGLYIAIEKFSLDRGVDFPTYANRRIGGSMLDNVRKNDFVPRSVRLNYSLIDKKRQELETLKGRRVTEYEIIEQLGINQQEYLANSKKYSPLSFVSLEGSDITDSSKSEDFKQDCIADLVDKSSSTPDSNLIRKEFINKLISKNFSPFEQKIIYYYYYENLTMGEIGKKINTSESRISQIHMDIIKRLRDKIERNPEFFGDNIEEMLKEGNNNDPLF
jgi:RNA polymerase sigma factor for flagellar operon FliA